MTDAETLSTYGEPDIKLILQPHNIADLPTKLAQVERVVGEAAEADQPILLFLEALNFTEEAANVFSEVAESEGFSASLMGRVHFVGGGISMEISGRLPEGTIEPGQILRGKAPKQLRSVYSTESSNYKKAVRVGHQYYHGGARAAEREMGTLPQHVSNNGTMVYNGAIAGLLEKQQKKRRLTIHPQLEYASRQEVLDQLRLKAKAQSSMVYARNTFINLPFDTEGFVESMYSTYIQDYLGYTAFGSRNRDARVAARLAEYKAENPDHQVIALFGNAHFGIADNLVANGLDVSVEDRFIYQDLLPGQLIKGMRAGTLTEVNVTTIATSYIIDQLISTARVSWSAELLNEVQEQLIQYPEKIVQIQALTKKLIPGQTEVEIRHFTALDKAVRTVLDLPAE